MKNVLSALLLIFLLAPQFVDAGGCKLHLVVAGDTIYCLNDPIGVSLTFSVGGTEIGCMCTQDEASNFQWFRNGQAIPGATAASYFVNDTGRYWMACKLCWYASAATEEIIVRYENCSGIENETANHVIPLNVFPNPAINEIVVTAPSSDNSKTKWTLYNICGQSIPLSPIAVQQNKWTFDIGLISPGIYIMKAETVKGVFIGKFNKE
ncbi:MAG TPA: T9SS type A sorting domain-containing protein [Chitinophagales bacterium]|nr:T9SS type A sorting domain-containing protein [Chitinophagales bacterium]